jgi:hypothetical protein
MNFGPNHYVPILKMKRAEKSALPAVSTGLRGSITPLFEVVERREDKGAAGLSAHLDTAFKGLAVAVAPYRRFFLDVREIEPDGADAAESAFERAAGEQMVFTPVTGISRRVDVDAALAHRANGIALRLTRDEFEADALAEGVRSFVRRHGLSCSEVDIILDLGPVDHGVPLGVERVAKAILRDLPDVAHWRTVTLSGCAFPWSMRIVERNSHKLVERSEWMAWLSGLYRDRSRLPRLPAFSDCGIQHTGGVEGFDYHKMPWSAAIRYACGEDKWLLIKGESNRSIPPSRQFPDLATQLVYGHLRTNFAGPSHCSGCSAIKAAADDGIGFGSAEIWRRLGTVHHLTVVAEAISVLPWP